MNFKLVADDQLDFIKGEIEQIKKILEGESKEEYQKSLLTNDELAKFLGLSVRTLQTYRDEGMIEFIQIGRKIFYEREAVNSFLEKFKIRPWSAKKEVFYEK